MAAAVHGERERERVRDQSNRTALVTTKIRTRKYVREKTTTVVKLAAVATTRAYGCHDDGGGGGGGGDGTHRCERRPRELPSRRRFPSFWRPMWWARRRRRRCRRHRHHRCQHRHRRRGRPPRGSTRFSLSLTLSHTHARASTLYNMFARSFSRSRGREVTDGDWRGKYDQLSAANNRVWRSRRRRWNDELVETISATSDDRFCRRRGGTRAV